MSWYLNRALTNFRAAVNARYPNRDKTSDGTIGDAAHQNTNSDHNPDEDGSVDAWDMDVDLRSGNDPAEIEKLKRVFERHESSHYWIHNDQISFRSEGWKPRSYAYAGPNRNRHKLHVHWNTRQSHETSNKPWILENEMKPEDVWRADIIPAPRPPVHNSDYYKSDGKTLNNVYWTARNMLRAILEGVRHTRRDIAELEKKVDGLTITNTTISDEQLERVLRKVLGSLDNV